MAFGQIAMGKFRQFEIFLRVIGFVILMSLVIPAAVAMDALDKHRLRKAASFFRCIHCGRTLGIDAVKRADEVWKEHVRELWRQHPDARLRIVRTLDAICPACATRYTLRKKERTFIVEEPWT